MSIEAISWVLNAAPIPPERRDASSLAMVLVGLANHADPDGANAFPSLNTLTRYTRLTRRSVQAAVSTLTELGLIEASDPDIVAAYVKRADRRPKGWNLLIPEEDRVVHSRVQSLRPADQHGMQTRHRGVQTPQPRGAATAPEPSLNHPWNRPGREPRSGLPPLCGHCDGRPHEGANTRVVWLDDDHTNSIPCPRCNPRSRNHPAPGRPIPPSVADPTPAATNQEESA